MNSYRHSNGCVQMRGRGGRFRKANLADFGIQVNKERLICGKCGHGKNGEFFPLIEAGECPICGNAEGHYSLAKFLDGLVGRELWFVMDYWEKFYSVPVKVTAVMQGRKIILAAENGEGSPLELSTSDPNALFERREAAEVAAFLLNGGSEPEE